MGEVFEATHARLPGRYAVKFLLPELTGHREAFARFCREAEVMSELRHPNVVQIFDFNTTPDGRPYFVMEFLEGRDLETRLNDEGPLPLPFAVRVVDAVASALAAAHAHGIVHRDLKPANIFLVTVDGQPDELIKVLDFGISKVRAAGTLLSTPSDVLGTPPYMSPEQARGATHLIDGRTDQFALGAITYRMLTGHDPFTGNDIASLLYQVVHQDAAAAGAVRAPLVGHARAAGGARQGDGQGSRPALDGHARDGARVRGRLRADAVAPARGGNARSQRRAEMGSQRHADRGAAACTRRDGRLPHGACDADAGRPPDAAGPTGDRPRWV